MYYALTIEVPLAEGGNENASITLNNQPYIWCFLGHWILGQTYDWETSGLMQDGQYLIEFKDEQSNYQNVPMCAVPAFGQANSGYMTEFPFPISFAGNKTLTFRVTNNYTRILTPTPARPVFKVHLVLAGIADWGELAG
jgi:hypothetical protein